MAERTLKSDRTPRPSAAVWLGRTAVVTALLLQILVARADDATWTGAANSDWGNSSNWNPNTVPGSGDTVSFNAAGDATIILGALGRTVHTILFGNAGSGHYTI